MSIKIILKAKKLIEDLMCPPATKDLELNTENRNAAIEAEHIQYGPLNLEDEDYWDKLAQHWKTTPEVAKESKCSNCVAFDISPRMKECMPGSVQEDGELGYCWMHHFKCHSARTCYTWASGGPILEDEISEEWQEKNKESLDEKKKDDRCTRIAKRKYDVWPSAYASGAVVRCRQGKIWKDLKEEEISEIINQELEETIKKVDGKWVVYPKSGGKILGTHDTEKEAKKQLAAIEISKQQNEQKDLTKAITKILRDEGGAAGLEAIVKGTKVSEKDIKDAIEAEEKFIKHTDGDIILKDDSLDEKKKKKAKTDYSKEKESGLHGWFSRQGGKGSSQGWVDCNTCRKDKKTGRKKCKSCGRKKGEKRSKYPSCRPTPAACGTPGKGKKWGKKKNESLDSVSIVIEEIQRAVFSQGLIHHVENQIPVTENIYRPGSIKYFNVVSQAREYYNKGLYETVNEEEVNLLENSDLGEWGMFEGERVPLDFPMFIDEIIGEAEYRGKKVKLNDPSRNTGSGKKYKVYVKNPKTGNVIQVTYGDKKGGLKGGWNDPESRASFAARHNCEEKKDKTKAGYWACRAHKDFGPGVGRFW